MDEARKDKRWYTQQIKKNRYKQTTDKQRIQRTEYHVIS